MKRAHYINALNYPQDGVISTRSTTASWPWPRSGSAITSPFSRTILWRRSRNTSPSPCSSSCSAWPSSPLRSIWWCSSLWPWTPRTRNATSSRLFRYTYNEHLHTCIHCDKKVVIFFYFAVVQGDTAKSTQKNFIGRLFGRAYSAILLLIAYNSAGDRVLGNFLAMKFNLATTTRQSLQLSERRQMWWQMPRRETQIRTL